MTSVRISVDSPAGDIDVTVEEPSFSGRTNEPEQIAELVANATQKVLRAYDYKTGDTK
ncbi:hypothetical protein ACIQYW_18475 [Rhodococcus erythropolis]|uniref:hypothetical protein n=1 Tax=Rhodococcus baikonurensis TaxID=172041 RepID=UPI0033909860